MGGESLKEELLQLIRWFGSSLSHRVSHLIAYVFDPRHASIGALAGFAIALVCTWKYLKTPGNRRKRLEKREVPSEVQASSEGESSGTSTAVSLSLSQSTQRGVLLREPEAPVQLTLAQIVRRQLNGGRKMTCQLLGVIFEETSPEELQKHAVVRPAVVDVLLELAKSCDLYLMARLLDDESEINVLSALEATGVFSVGLNRNKVLFCSTEAGRSSFVRQLEPDWHVDTSVETLSELARFIRYELHISPKGTGHMASNIFGSETLESYFGMLGTN